MSSVEEQPAAVRAVASSRQSWWTHRQVRVCRYDACWPDGRVDFDVNLVKAMYRGSPADFEPIERTVRETCPEVGVGPWIDRQAQIVDGPTPDEPSWLKSGTGRPMPYRTGEPSGITVRDASNHAWRLGPGVAALAIGILMLSRAAGSTALILIGAVCVLIGVASLASLVISRRR